MRNYAAGVAGHFLSHDLTGLPREEVRQEVGYKDAPASKNVKVLKRSNPKIQNQNRALD